MDWGVAAEMAAAETEHQLFRAQEIDRTCTELSRLKLAQVAAKERKDKIPSAVRRAVSERMFLSSDKRSLAFKPTIKRIDDDLATLARAKAAYNKPSRRELQDAIERLNTAVPWLGHELKANEEATAQVPITCEQQIEASRAKLAERLGGATSALWSAAQGAGVAVEPFSAAAWGDWGPGSESAGELLAGTIWRPGTRSSRLSMPVFFAIPGENIAIPLHYMDSSRRRTILAWLSSMIVRALADQPPGRLRCTFIDADTLGEAFAPLLEIGNYSDAIMDTKVWTSTSEIDAKLNELVGHTSRIIQKYLTGRYDTIADYNREAQETAEPYRLVVVNGFPQGFSPEAARSMVNLMEVGPRCGVSFLFTEDQSNEWPHSIKREELYANVSASIAVGRRHEHTPW